MPTTTYIDPTSTTADGFDSGDYTAVDDGVRQPTTPTTTPSSETIYDNDPGAHSTTMHWSTITGVANRRITEIKLWRYRSGTNNGDLTFATTFSTALGSSSSAGNVGSWFHTTWSGLYIDASSNITPSCVVTSPSLAKGDGSHIYAAMYIEYTYEDETTDYDESYTPATTAEENGGTVTLNPTGTVNIDDDGKLFAMQFDSIVLDQGETVTEAILALGVNADTEGECDLWGDDSDTASNLTTGASNISNRTSTTAVVNLDNNTPNGTTISIDVTSVLQEIVDRGGWSTGNNIVLVLEGFATNVNDWGINADITPELFIDHPNTGGGGGGGDDNGKMGKFLLFLDT